MDLDDISEQLDRLITAVEKNTSNRWTWVWVVLAIWLVSATAVDTWYSKTRFVLMYGVDYDQVTIDKKPHDCDFFKAPLGSKECHYERNVQRVIVGTNRWNGQAVSNDDGKTWEQHAKNELGNPIVSEDSGRTWTVEQNPGVVKPSVNVFWSKVEDED